MNECSKKPWSQPRLVVLVRGTSEESVLQTCKGGAGASRNTADTGCAVNPGNCGNACTTIASS